MHSLAVSEQAPRPDRKRRVDLGILREEIKGRPYEEFFLPMNADVFGVSPNPSSTVESPEVKDLWPCIAHCPSC